MKKITHLVAVLLLGIIAHAQVQVVGHSFLNNRPLNNTKVIVKLGKKVYTTLNTGNENEFKFEVDCGPDYKVYLQNEKSPVMFFEIITSNIPANRRDFGMRHSFDAALYDKADPDVDTTVFKDAFYRIVYDGKKYMVEDTTYDKLFESRILKKRKPVEPVTKEEKAVPQTEQATVFSGKVFLNNDKLQPVKNKHIYALDKNGKVLKSSSTNRFGVFVFSGIKLSELAKIKMDLLDDVSDHLGKSVTSKTSNSSELNDLLTGNLGLYNSKATLLQFAKANEGACIWNLTERDAASLTDENYSSSIGGKLVSSSAKVKKFYANKTVYLSNNFHTVLGKTTTNMMGSFVFENIKPDKTYHVGIDKSEIGPGEKVDLLNKDDSYISTLDSEFGDKTYMKINSDFNPVFNKFTVDEDELKMDVKAAIYGDDVNHPIGKLKIVLLNDSYQPIDSVLTDNFGTFKFKYLPFLKRFYLTAENSDAVLDEFKNILIYSSNKTLVKVLTHQKGKRFTYNPISGELVSLRDVEIEDPWLEFVDKKPGATTDARRSPQTPKAIIEPILFESNKYDINTAGKSILDKIILVMNTNKNLKIEIGAHTDSKGAVEDNLVLSNNRAKAVRDYMVTAGIEDNRILWKGYGESKLLNKCADGQECTEDEHAKNRRIEFKILGE